MALGGHDIPEFKIRESWSARRENLIQLLPHLFELIVFDNTANGAPEDG